MHAAYSLGNINYKRANDPPGRLFDPGAIFCLDTKIDVPASKRDEKLAVEPLIQTLEDEVANVRKAAVSALEKIGDLRATEPLTKALNDIDENVRTTANKAIEKLKANKK
jgi:HEAT repeat protein